MRIAAIGIIVLAIVIGVVPTFNNCSYDGNYLKLANGKDAPMKCYWSAQAEIAMAAPLLALGAVLGFSKRKETRRGLGVMGIVLGAFVMAIPTQLIGVCSSAMKQANCNLVLMPATLLAGGLVVAISAVTLVVSLRGAEELL